LNWCSPAEVQRAQAIALPRRRAQFLGGRWLARQTLSEHCGGTPADWQLCCEEGCAPLVECGPMPASVSIAHRFEALACAVSDHPGGVDAIGVDLEVEPPRPRQNPDQVAEIMLSPAEARSYAHTAPPERAALLRALWVLKEAWLKSRGMPLELSQLPLISASPVVPEAANARLWVEGALTLGLVCGNPEALANVRVTGLVRGVSSQAWLVAADQAASFGFERAFR
jgi:phosphopantetheinyl transferase